MMGRNSEPDSDAIRALNNLLQQYRDPRLGNFNLTRHFSWAMAQTGPEHQKTHYATAKLHGKIIGTGNGVAATSAKSMAAIQALHYLRSLPPTDPMFSLR